MAKLSRLPRLSIGISFRYHIAFNIARIGSYRRAKALAEATVEIACHPPNNLRQCGALHNAAPYNCRKETSSCCQVLLLRSEIVQPLHRLETTGPQSLRLADCDRLLCLSKDSGYVLSHRNSGVLIALIDTQYVHPG